ncbi:LPXTG cell wall anchor domain-containing protein [Lactococcus lactis subsp. lactis]|nr:LPXTG cell wall anchor domain-containing protein [Lactococcus lactis subsp. lactis]MCT0511596.1 LPXTG cell wall anchor domain-containing protein [Lactococcus cremoris]
MAIILFALGGIIYYRKKKN